MNTHAQPTSDNRRTPMQWLQFALPILISAVIVAYLLGQVGKATGGDELAAYDYTAFGAIPVSEDGRVKPLDTVARNALLQISGKQSLVEEMLLDGEDKGLPAIVWLAEVAGQRPEAWQRPVFRIDDPDVLGLMGKTTEDGKYFSIDDIRPALKEIEDQARAAQDVPDDQRSRFQEHVIGLRRNVGLVFELQNHMRPYVLAPTQAGEEWKPLNVPGTSGRFADSSPESRSRPTGVSWAWVLESYRNENAEQFNTKVQEHLAAVGQEVSGEIAKARFEQGFNAYRPFALGVVFYILAGLIGAMGMLFRPMLSEGWYKSVWRTGMGVLVLTFVLHTAALIVRMWLQGRPPVTNLYSSAVFIGWAVVAFSIVMELISRLGVASLASSIVGVATLLIAHNLAKDGDTMGVMQAVLDSNFWLGTHVIAVVLGYSATFFAGFLAILYIFLGVCTPVLDRKSARLMSSMVYAVICFALLFSFVGTVLGGIWADQSWGRFWGWDPKENGAIMIVLMNAITLHARWGHLVKDRGIMVLAVAGNIITAWSWFGTNLLGVGLHSYGFMDGAMFYLVLFVVSQLVIMAIAMALPTRYWWSFMPRRGTGSGNRVAAKVVTGSLSSGSA